MNSYVNEGRTIDIKRLFIEYFKRWRIILIAVLAGAILMACLCALKLPDAMVPDEEPVTSNQKLIDSNNAGISEHQNSINSNNSQIPQIQRMISMRENDIVSAKEELEDQQTDLATYENLLKEAYRIMASASRNSRADLIAQIFELTEKISAVKNEIAATEKEIAGYEKDISGMQYTIDVSITDANENLNGKIAELQKNNEDL